MGSVYSVLNAYNPIPAYFPNYNDLPQYSMWGASFLMMAFVIMTTFALATVTMMDKNVGTSGSILPKIGGKKSKTK